MVGLHTRQMAHVRIKNRKRPRTLLEKSCTRHQRGFWSMKKSYKNEDDPVLGGRIAQFGGPAGAERLIIVQPLLCRL